MLTQAIEALIEHCKHIGSIERIFMQPLIAAAQAELDVIKSTTPPPHDQDSFCRIQKHVYIEGVCADCGHKESWNDNLPRKK